MKIYNQKAPDPVGSYMFKVNIRNTRTRCEICSKLTIKTPGVFIVNFWIYFTLCFSVSIVNFEQVIVGWVMYNISEDFLLMTGIWKSLQNKYNDKP